MEKIHEYVREFEEQLKVVNEQLGKYEAREVSADILKEEMGKLENIRSDVYGAMAEIITKGYRAFREEREQRNLRELGYWS